MTSRLLRRQRDDQGSALVELTWLAIILLVPLIWIIMSVFEVQQGAFATSAAARAAGRAYALAPDDRTGEERARAVVRQVLQDQGAPGQQARVQITCEAPGGNCHVGTAVITGGAGGLGSAFAAMLASAGYDAVPVDLHGTPRALDVTDPEPLPAGHWLFSEPRARVTPHLSWSSSETMRRVFARLAENIRRLQAGETLLGAVD